MDGVKVWLEPHRGHGCRSRPLGHSLHRGNARVGLRVPNDVAWWRRSPAHKFPRRPASAAITCMHEMPPNTVLPTIFSDHEPNNLCRSTEIANVFHPALIKPTLRICMHPQKTIFSINKLCMLNSVIPPTIRFCDNKTQPSPNLLISSSETIMRPIHASSPRIALSK